MTVDEVLVPLGDAPINSSPYSFVLLAMVNSYLSRHNMDEVAMDTPANVVLGEIWKLPEDERRGLLKEIVSGVRDRNSYRVTLTGIAILLGVVVVPVMVVEVLSAGSQHSGLGFNFLIQLAELATTFFENEKPD